MHKVFEILDRHVESFSIKPKWTVREAAQYMSERNIGAAAVVDENFHVLGMFSERDILKRVVAAGLDPDKITVEEVMSRDVVTTEPGECLDICSYKMNQHRCRHLPVVENNRLVGMISIRDIHEIRLRDFAEENEQLRAYFHLVPPGYPTR